jgi:hypothetical protein
MENSGKDSGRGKGAHYGTVREKALLVLYIGSGF